MLMPHSCDLLPESVAIPISKRFTITSGIRRMLRVAWRGNNERPRLPIDHLGPGHHTGVRRGEATHMGAK